MKQCYLDRIKQFYFLYSLELPALTHVTFDNETFSNQTLGSSLRLHSIT